MTLNTEIRILDPVQIEPLFRFCQSLLGDPATMRVETHTAGDLLAGSVHFENSMIQNSGDQGLAAWLQVEYHPDGPLRSYCDICDCEPDERCNPRPGPAVAEISFDTAGGYETDNGAGCGALHAWLVTQVAAYLKEQDVRRWAWQNEFTGEWFADLNEIHQLGDPDLGALKGT